MRLFDFPLCFDECVLLEDTEVTGLSCDSRRCKKGDMFFCKGAAFKKEYALEAQNRGAVVFVCQTLQADMLRGTLDKPVIAVNDVMRCMAQCAAHFYGYPMRRLISVAVTGTKGKTTTAYYINSAINAQHGLKCAILSSLVLKNAPRLTTPEPIDFHAAAARAVQDGCTHIVCEISSQAQKLGRTYGILFDIACFLNFGRDHISQSEHASEEEYYECKRSLFDMCKTAVVNIDTDVGKRLLDSIAGSVKKISASSLSKNADYYTENIKMDGYGCDLLICGKNGEVSFPLVILALGEHNVQNALCASAVLKELNIENKAIFSGIMAGEPDGRGLVLTSKDKCVSVIVDYAHNEISFGAMFKMVKRQFAGATVTVIFGCPGEKAHCRRRQLVGLCADNADKVTVCEDDSGAEGYDKISAELQGYFCEVNGSRLKSEAVSYIKSRRMALRAALNSAAEDGGRHIILLLGKGDERVNRGCGCDEACDSDIKIAREELDGYDMASAASGMLDENAEGGSVAVCIDDISLVGTASFALARLVQSKKTQICVVCDEKMAPEFSLRCFCEGAVAVLINGSDTSSSVRKSVKRAKSAQKMGMIPVFVCKSCTKKNAVKIAKACEAEKLVYLTLGRGILFNGNITTKRLSYRRAMLINSAFPEENLKNAGKALRAGVKNVAFIDARESDSIIRYFRAESCVGIAFCGE